MSLSSSADLPYMSKENRLARLLNTYELSAPAYSLDNREQILASRQQLRERAHRLYAIGEMNLAAQLFSILAACTQPQDVELGAEAIHG
jgi:hypothetical protein